MQDPRIRLVAGAGLSCAAFISIPGAAAAFVWWLVFTPGLQLIKKIQLVISLIILIAFFSFILEITGGGGFSYFIRMTVIILIGMWIYTEQQSGEFLSLGVWLFGKRTGFDLGLLAEAGMQCLSSMVSDLERIRISEKLKGMKWGLSSIVPVGLVLIHGSLMRAEDTAEIMAVRGYRRGGRVCPVFVTHFRDVIAGAAALCVLVIAFVPLREFFILYR
jgi:energy-coupling factor transport system permease protein